jgi:catechol 2,3-dioxygenase-like lactoylglutathione lyase family enzyme
VGEPLGVGSRATGVGFVGFRTDRFDDMVRFFGESLGLERIRDAEGAAWFRLGDGELHVYDVTDPDHAFFTAGPVVGLVVDDVGALRGRLEPIGIEFIGEVQRSWGAAWSHFRAPDGTVMEIIDRRG